MRDGTLKVIVYMKALLHHLFLPHHKNNHRAKILHHKTLLVIIVFFLYQAFIFPKITNRFPQVLGSAVDISSQDLLLLTNQQRLQAGVGPLVINDELAQAAKMKAADMFAHNFWAHNDPDGTTPWDFIKKAHYDYIYAGENLARGFTSSQDVIDAWMHSPEHRDNMLSPSYRDVGFAVAQGNLTGENNTVLIVEMFGSTQLAPQQAVLPGKAVPQKAQLPLENTSSAGISAIFHTPLINTGPMTKTIGTTFVLLFIAILVLDIIIIQRKNVVRIFEHNVDHVLFLAFILLAIGLLSRGIIY